MDIVSKIFDKRIKALNILLDMKIKEYLEFGEKILEKNDFQRKRVRRSSSVYQLLKNDLIEGCLMPPIVLAVHSDGLNGNKFAQTTPDEKMPDEEILGLLTPDNLIILDGLQRTHTLIQIIEEFKSNKLTKKLDDFYDKPLRVEIYLGLSKTGVLYRMLTLNTGQTPMSTRHQIEILYSDYRDNEIDHIKLLTERDSSQIKDIGQYQFRNVVEGFNSYLDRNELGIDRAALLENIENLEKLSKEDQTVDLFKEYISSYNKIVLIFQNKTGDWTFDKEAYTDLFNVGLSNPFARNTVDLFTKKQMLSGYGAAIGKLKEFELINGFSDVVEYFEKTMFSDDPHEDIYLFLRKISEINAKAKKIGQAQRFYISFLFRELFNKDSESFCNLQKSIERAYEKYQYELG